MSVVLDASLALAWCFQDESNALTDRALETVTQHGATVPFLWRVEVANGLQSAIRRKRIDAAYRDASLADLAALPITVDIDGVERVWSSALSLAGEYGLTVYDACYLELALRTQKGLATLDAAMISAGRKMKIPLPLA